MAVLKSYASGNFNGSTTFKVVNATSYLNDNSGGSVSVPTSFTSSSNFTPGAITVEGIMLYMSKYAGSTGTFSTRLYNATGSAAVSGTTVTVNCSDIKGNGWMYFKFASPVTLLGSTNYNVQVSASNASTAYLYTDATTNNWCRGLVTSTTATAAASDKTFILGDWTAAATNTAYTVTMNVTSNATAYGEINIGSKGTLSYGTSASTNYWLKVTGNIIIGSDGIFNIGTSGTPIPSTSTAKLEFNCSSAGQYGISVLDSGTLSTYGNTKVPYAKIAADVSAAATSITTDVTTSWLSGDVVAVSSTTQTSGEVELKTLGTNASGTTVTVPSLTYAHGGNSTTGVQGEVINLTRNVKIFGQSSSNTCYIDQPYPYNSLNNQNPLINLFYTEFYYIGANATGLGYPGNNGGISFYFSNSSSLAVTAINIQYCSFHDSDSGCAIMPYAAWCTFKYNVVYNMQYGISYGAGVNNIVIENNIFLKGSYGMYAFSSPSFGGASLSIQNNVFSSYNTGAQIFVQTDNQPTIQNNIAHSNSSTGFQIGGNFSSQNGYLHVVIGANTAWRNLQQGLLFGGTTNSYYTSISTDQYLEINGWTLFGNNYNIGLTSLWGVGIIRSCSLQGGTGIVAGSGIQHNSSTFINRVSFENCTIGNVTAHNSIDVSLGNNEVVDFVNCTFGSAGITANGFCGFDRYPVTSTNHNNTAGNHMAWDTYATMSSDTSVYRTASPSVKIKANGVGGLLHGAHKKVPVVSGTPLVPSVYVRQSSTGDGAQWAGNSPQLIARRNPQIGILNDTVIATATSAGRGSFELLTGTSPTPTADGVMELYILANGIPYSHQGWINIDDFSVTGAASPDGFAYWDFAQPFLSGGAGGGSSGSSYTFAA